MCCSYLCLRWPTGGGIDCCWCWATQLNLSLDSLLLLPLTLPPPLNKRFGELDADPGHVPPAELGVIWDVDVDGDGVGGALPRLFVIFSLAARSIAELRRNMIVLVDGSKRLLLPVPKLLCIERFSLVSRVPTYVRGGRGGGLLSRGGN